MYFCAPFICRVCLFFTPIKKIIFINLCLLSVFSPATADVEFNEATGKAEQSITLKVGWNSVYLWVQPDVPGLEDHLADVPNVTRVATFAQPVSRATMAENDSENFQHKAEWKIWRSGSFLSKINTLKGLRGARGYLFYALAPTTLSITGEFVDYDKYVSWVGDRFNFQSFPVVSDSVSFSSYLSANSKLDQELIYELNDSGAWSLVNPRDLIDPEKAYWVYCHNGTDFTGNVVRAGRPTGFTPVIGDAGSTVYQASLELNNKIRSPVNINMKAALPLTAKVVRPGQFLNAEDVSYQSLSSVDLELSDQTSNQVNVMLQLPEASVTEQLNHTLEITTPQGDRKFYPFSIEGNS